MKATKSYAWGKDNKEKKIQQALERDQRMANKQKEEDSKNPFLDDELIHSTRHLNSDTNQQPTEKERVGEELSWEDNLNISNHKSNNENQDDESSENDRLEETVLQIIRKREDMYKQSTVLPKNFTEKSTQRVHLETPTIEENMFNMVDDEFIPTQSKTPIFQMSDPYYDQNYRIPKLQSQPTYSGKTEENVSIWLDLMEHKNDRVLVASTYLRDNANLYFSAIRKINQRTMVWSEYPDKIQ